MTMLGTLITLFILGVIGNLAFGGRWRAPPSPEPVYDCDDGSFDACFDDTDDGYNSFLDALVPEDAGGEE
jgi:hypothetical protein